MKKIIGLFILLICTLFRTTIAYAGDCQISGVIVDAEGLPLPSAAVMLHKGDNTQHEQGTATDPDGKFSFTGLSEGDYRLIISFMGYKTKTVATKLTNEKKSVKYQKIILQEDAALLSAVEVEAKRSSLQVDIDKKTFLVNESAVTDGMSASEILKEIPSVDVDVEGNVSLRNNENVEIYINGKPSGLTEENRGDLLEQLPAGSIERVEVITNPSSKFSAEGSAGIINIVMKNNTKQATYYGSVSAGISYPWGWKPGGNVGGNICVNKNKWSTTASIGYTNKKFKGESLSERETYKTDTTLLNQYSDIQFNMNTIFTRISTSCQIDSTNKIGLAGMFSYGGRDRNQYLDYDKGYLNDGASIFNTHQQRNALNHAERLMGNATIDYAHDFAQGHTLSTAFNFSANSGKSDRDYEQIQMDSLYSVIAEKGYDQYQYTYNHNRNYEFQTDYVNPLTPTSKLEAGLKLSFQNQFNEVNSSIKKQGDDDYVAQKELDNDFELHQNIYAAYTSWGAKFHKFSMQLGLRGELTDQDWSLNTTGEKSTQKPYFDLFPTAYFAYKLTDNDELQLSYTRRVSRPRRYWINPYINLSDSTNISFGNPNLKPEYANMIEMNYVKNFSKHTFTASLYYKLCQDIVQRYSWMQQDAMISTFANMTNSHSAGLELILKNSWKVVNLTSNINFYYYKLKGGDFNITSVFNGTTTDVDVTIHERQSFSWKAKISADFSLPKAFALQVTGDYKSPVVTAQGKSLYDYFFNLGLKKSFLQKSLIATLSVRDLLNSRKRRADTWGDDFFQHSESQWSGRTISLNVTYNFGNMKKNGKRDKDSSFGSSDSDVYEEF